MKFKLEITLPENYINVCISSMLQNNFRAKLLEVSLGLSMLKKVVIFYTKTAFWPYKTWNEPRSFICSKTVKVFKWTTKTNHTVIVLCAETLTVKFVLHSNRPNATEPVCSSQFWPHVSVQNLVDLLIYGLALEACESFKQISRLCFYLCVAEKFQTILLASTRVSWHFCT